MGSFQKTINSILTGGRKRELEGRIVKKIIFAFTVAIALYHLYTLGIWRAYTTEVHSFVHLSSFLVLVFLIYSSSTKRSTRLPVIDLIILSLALVVVTYFATRVEQRLIGDPVYRPLSNPDFAFGILLLFLIFEGTRRAVGLPFGIVMLCFVLLMGLGSYLPGKWAFQGFPLRQIIDMLVWSPVEGIWGIPLRVSATVIIMFFIFGKLMQHAGIGNLLISLCHAAAGGTRGGPAKVAVVGSGLVGSVTGGPASNIVMTGTFTIPMMKQVGYKPHYAGGVECAASTGASIVPPVMTGVVFVMAALTGIPYVKIMVAALIPAFLYYLGILLQVHFQAIKLNIGGASEKRASMSQVCELLREEGHLLLPIMLLVVLLLLDYTPVMAAFWSSFSVVFAAGLKKKTRMGLRQIMMALDEAVREATTIALTLSLSGIILISLFTTGLGGMFTHTVSVAAGDSLLLLALMAAIVSLVMGMMGPIIGSYLITILIVAPAMVKAGLPTIVAHFFSLYFANIAFITPPVAIGAFVAASIAKANFWSIGFTAIRLSFASFIVPFIFIYRPGLLMIGNPLEIIPALLVGMAVVVCFASALEGWMLARLNVFERIFLFWGGFGFISNNFLAIMLSIILLGLVLIWQVIDKRRESG